MGVSVFGIGEIIFWVFRLLAAGVLGIGYKREHTQQWNLLHHATQIIIWNFNVVLDAETKLGF